MLRALIPSGRSPERRRAHYALSSPRVFAGDRSLHLLMQSPVVTDRVLAAKDSRVQRMLDTYKDDRRVVTELFLATLSRPPSESELKVGLDAMAKNRVQGAQDLQWALINQVEFMFNY